MTFLHTYKSQTCENMTTKSYIGEEINHVRVNKEIKLLTILSVSFVMEP